MTLIRRKIHPNNSFNSLLDELFDSSLTRFPSKDFNANTPAINVREDENEYRLEVAAPGRNKEDFKVELEGNTLTISSDVKTENSEKSENGRYTRREFSYASFRRAFTLPKDEVDATAIKAKYEDGILHINVPKKELKKVEASTLIEIA